jgi:hypothetical protein
MSDSKHTVKAIAAGTLIIALAIGLSCRKSPESKPSTPAESKSSTPPPASVETLFAVQVDNFDFTLSQMDQFLVGVSPIPMGLQMLVRMQLAGVLGSPELAGLNMGGKFRAFGVLLPDDSGSAEPAARTLIAGLLPFSDYTKLVAENPKFSKPDNNGISQLTVSFGMPGMPADPNAAPSGPTILITKLDNAYALITPKSQYDKVVLYKKLFAASKATGDARYPGAVTEAGYPISIYGDIQTAAKAFGPLVTQKFNEIKSMVEQQAGAAAQTPGQGAMMDQKMVSGAMNMYAGLLDTIMKEVKSFALAVKPSPDVLFIKETVSAVPGTETAQMLVADASASKENELMGYLKDGSAMNFAAKMNKPLWEKLTIKGLDLLGAIAGQSLSTDHIAKMKKLMADAMDSMGGPLAGVFSVNAEGKSLFAMDYVVAVKDAAKFNKMLDESVDLFKTTGILDLYKGLGIEMDYTMTQNTENYNGVSIDSAKLTMKPTDPNSPIGQMLDAMYGGVDYRWGIVDGLCAIAIGSDADSAAHRLIDLAKTGGPKEICTEVKDALKMLPDAGKADFFVTYNYVRILSMAGKMMPAMAMGGANVTMPQINIPSKSNINIAGKVGSGSLVVDVAVPKQHLSELVTAFMMLQQEIMKQQGAMSTD